MGHFIVGLALAVIEIQKLFIQADTSVFKFYSYFAADFHPRNEFRIFGLDCLLKVDLAELQSDSERFNAFVKVLNLLVDEKGFLIFEDSLPDFD